MNKLNLLVSCFLFLFVALSSGVALSWETTEGVLVPVKRTCDAPDWDLCRSTMKPSSYSGKRCSLAAPRQNNPYFDEIKSKVLSLNEEVNHNGRTYSVNFYCFLGFAADVYEPKGSGHTDDITVLNIMRGSWQRFVDSGQTPQVDYGIVIKQSNGK